MTKGDWQLFIPGWQIVYMLRRWRQLELAEKFRAERAAKLEAETRRIERDILAYMDGHMFHLTDGRCDGSSAMAYVGLINRMATRHFDDLLRALKRPA